VPIFGLTTEKVNQMHAKNNVKGLVKALKDKNIDIRRAAVLAISKSEYKDALDGLVAALRDPDSEIRYLAAIALEKIADLRAVDGLVDALKDPDVLVRYSSADALGKIGGAHAVDALITALHDPEPIVRLHATEGLCRIEDPRTINELVSALKDPDKHVNRAAATALIKFGGEHKIDGYLFDLWNDEILEIALEHNGAYDLIAAFKEPNEESRLKSIEILSKIKRERVIKDLITVLRAPDANGQLQAIITLTIGTAVIRNQASILCNLDNTPPMREDAAFTLARCGGAYAAAKLGYTLYDKDPLIALTASRALSTMGGTDAFDELAAFLNHWSDYTFHPKALQILRAILEMDTETLDERLPVLLKLLDRYGTHNSDIFFTLSRTGKAEMIDPCIKHIFVARTWIHINEKKDLELVNEYKKALQSFIPISSLTNHLVQLIIDAAFDVISRGVRYECSDKAIADLCEINSPVSSNILHLVTQKESVEFDFSVEDDIQARMVKFSFDKQIWQAIEELKKRGNPPYQVDAYMKSTSA
jgi:HEAT repeat protein